MSPQGLCLCVAVAMSLAVGLLAAAPSLDDLATKVETLTQEVSELTTEDKHEEFLEHSYRAQVDALIQGQLKVLNIFIKTLSINRFKYDVSSLYDEQIYIVSKDTQEFNLEEMNKLCQQSNGFLAEIRDEAELEFLEELVMELGSNIYMPMAETM